MAHDLQQVLPAGFLKDYVAYAATLTDAPPEFHAFTALTTLGAAASQVRVPFGDIAAPVTLWTVLVAPSAFYRKTTAMELGRRMLEAGCLEAVTPMLYRYDAVHAQLRRVQRLLLVDQFTELLTNDARERLIEASDAHAPLSILAAASTAHLTAQLASLDVASGFVSRFVLVVAEQKTRLLGEPGARRPEAEARLAKFLENASYLQGPARFDSVRGELMRWGRSAADWISSHRGKSGLWESAAGLVSRMELTVRKLAVLVEIAVSGSLEVSPASMNAAAALEHFTRSAFTRLMNEEIGRAREFNDELRLLGILRRNPGITRSRLQRSSHLDAETFRRALSALALAGSIRLDGPRISARGRNGNGIASAANVANAADFQLTAP